jgi:hypothetical protein
MSRIWELKKQAILRDLFRCAERSRVLSVIAANDAGPEIHAVVKYRYPTLVKNEDGHVTLAGPVVAAVRYSERLLSEAPHPLEIAALLAPANVFHPNLSKGGLICMGHPTPGLSMEQILHTLWAAITFNMHYLNVRPGEVMNREAAEHVQHFSATFPLTEAGLFEAEPID